MFNWSVASQCESAQFCDNFILFSCYSDMCLCLSWVAYLKSDFHEIWIVPLLIPSCFFSFKHMSDVPWTDDLLASLELKTQRVCAFEVKWKMIEFHKFWLSILIHSFILDYMGFNLIVSYSLSFMLRPYVKSVWVPWDGWGS